jgi:UDP-N-acetylmuramoyl-tripeptide--D-alanyl-D-alanine ligase
MIEASLTKLLEIVGGKIVFSTSTPNKYTFRGVCHNTADLRGGELFVALKGEKTHGHCYVDTAFNRGASLALIEDDALECSYRDRTIVVKNTLSAYSELAHWWRNKCNIPILAVTGSVGKTTVKEMIASILLTKSVGLYSEKSYNNHTGVPFTLCKLSPEHQWGVVEIGMNHQGEIAKLSKIVKPNVVLITKIEPAHIGAFGSLKEIAVEKLSIIYGLNEHGRVVLNGDDELLMETFLNEFSNFPPTNTYRFGEEKSEDLKDNLNICFANYKSNHISGSVFKLKSPADSEESQSVTFSVVGKHNVYNATAAALGVKALFPTITLEEIKNGLQKFKAPLMRLNFKETLRGITLIDDTYNANLGSMKALLSLVADLSEGNPERVGLVLGQMNELGEFAKSMHFDLGRLAVQTGVKHLLFKGANQADVLEGAKAEGGEFVTFTDFAEAVDLINAWEVDYILFKASRSLEFEKLVASVQTKLSHL